MDINIKAQKGVRTFVLIVLAGVGVFLTVSAAQYGYQVWVRARQPREGALMPTGAGGNLISPVPPVLPTGSLFEPLVSKEPMDVLDYSSFVGAYGTADPTYDFNKDGIVDNADLEIFRQKYQQNTTTPSR